MSLVKVSCLFCFVLAIVACTSGLVQAMDEEACKNKGGEWKTLGLAGSYNCVIATSDAGKPCNDSSECESVCVVPDVDQIAEDSDKKGVCHDKNTQLGTCLARVVKGEVTPRLCVD